MNSPSDAASGGSGLTPEVSRRDGVTHSLGPCGVLGVVLVFLGVYLLTASGHLHTIDSYHVYNVTRSLVEQGDLTIPPSYMAVEGRDGRYYSKFGVGQSVLAVPIFGFAKALEGVLPAVVVNGMDQAQQQVRVRLGGQVAAPQYLSEWPRAPGDAFRATVVVLFFNPIVSALGLGLLLRLLLDLGVHRATAVIAITALALGTFLWPLSRDFFQHPLEMTLLIAVLLLWVRGTGQLSPALAALMGAVNGLAVLTRVFTVVWVPLFLLALVVDLRSRRASMARLMLILGSYLGPVLLACGVVLWLNDLRFGEFTKFGYHTSYDSGGFTTPLFTGLRGNLISWERGLFFYAPHVLIGLLGVPMFARQHARLAALSAALVGVYVFGYSKWWAFHGGWCLGPRFLLPCLPLLTLPAAVWLSRLRRRLVARASFLLLAVVGATVNVVLMSPEYTAMYRLTHGRMYSLGQALRALVESGPVGLDYFFVYTWKFLDSGWFMLFLSLPLTVIGTGLVLLRADVGPRSAD